MNNIYVIFYFINIFATQIHAASMLNAANIYDVVSANFSKKCPVLSNNILVNSTTKYLSRCKNVSILNPPERISMFNMDKFYCIGILVADMQLCNSVLKYNYTLLPTSFEELELNIDSIKQSKPLELCDLLKNTEIFNDTTIIPTLSKTISALREKLTGSQCERLCSDIDNDVTTNELCSIIYCIDALIGNISRVVAQQKISTDITSTASKKSTAVVNSANISDYTKLERNSTNITKLSFNNEGGKNNKTAAPRNVQHKGLELAEKPPTKPNSVPNVKPLEAIPPRQNVDERVHLAQKDIIPIESEATTTLPSSLPTLPPVATGKHKEQQPEDNSLKNIQPTHGEDQSKKIKNIGDVTNETPKNTNAAQKPPVSPDEKDYHATSTEINIRKPSSDEYEDDEEENLKINDDANPVAEKVQDDLLNSRADINPSIKQSVDVEESNFFSYFMFISVMFIAGYVVYHNKQKLMALVLEGRRDRNSRRRPSTSSYRKLNSNLEEAVTSKCSGSASHVIY